MDIKEILDNIYRYFYSKRANRVNKKIYRYLVSEINKTISDRIIYYLYRCPRNGIKFDTKVKFHLKLYKQYYSTKNPYEIYIKEYYKDYMYYNLCSELYSLLGHFIYDISIKLISIFETNAKYSHSLMNYFQYDKKLFVNAVVDEIERNKDKYLTGFLTKYDKDIDVNKFIMDEIDFANGKTVYNKKQEIYDELLKLKVKDN